MMLSLHIEAAEAWCLDISACDETPLSLVSSENLPAAHQQSAALLLSSAFSPLPLFV